MTFVSKVLSFEKAQLWRLKPGQKLCVNCLYKKRRNENSSSVTSSSHEEFQISDNDTAGNVLDSFNLTPIKSVSSRDKVSYKRKKLNQITSSARKSLNFFENRI